MVLNPVNEKEEERKPDPAVATANGGENANISMCGSSNDTGNDEVITAMFVPVILSHRDHPNIEVCVYALLDDGSDSTFVKDSAAKDLSVSGTKMSQFIESMVLLSKSLTEASHQYLCPRRIPERRFYQVENRFQCQKLLASGHI